RPARSARLSVRRTRPSGVLSPPQTKKPLEREATGDRRDVVALLPGSGKKQVHCFFIVSRGFACSQPARPYSSSSLTPQQSTAGSSRSAVFLCPRSPRASAPPP